MQEPVLAAVGEGGREGGREPHTVLEELRGE